MFQELPQVLAEPTSPSRSAYLSAYRRAHKEESRAYSRAWYQANKERLRGRRRTTSSAWNLSIRNKVLDLLGGVCVRCGEDERMVLCVDHIEGGGTKENKGESRLPGVAYLRYLKELKAGVTGTYALICHNCNWIKRHENREWGGWKDTGKTAVAVKKANALNRRRAKQQLIDALDGGRCRWCGFDDIRALHIDHVFGGGKRDAERRGGSASTRYRQYLAEVQAGSQEFETLCANCNFAKEGMSL